MTNPTPDQNQQTRLNVDNESSDSPYPPPSLNHTCAGDILKKLSRRKWLRDSAITATGAVLLPSFLTGCHKDVWDIVKGHNPSGGLGGVEPPTQPQLKAAADNINNMRELIGNLYDEASRYDVTVLSALDSTRANNNWTGFIVDVFIDIAVGFGTLAFPENAVAAQAIGFLGKFTKEWGIGKNLPPDLSGLNSFFSEYEKGQQAMKIAIDEKLGHYSDINYPTNDYANLKAAWNDEFVFMEKSYTVSQLANMYFPEKKDNSDEYYAIFNPLFLHHKKAVWNLVVMKCCEYYENYHLSVVLENTLTYWAQTEFYRQPQYAGTYLRGWITEVRNGYGTTLFEVCYWNLGIGGYPFPQAAIDVLFIDDTPGHVINPQGLFHRDYVFKQFSTYKGEGFLKWHELANTPDSNFSGVDDFVFTGGMFPKLTHP